MDVGLISIIIPVFQVSEYIERCIRSVISQSYSEIECILVDDATRDDSIAKSEAIICDYNGPIRFRFLHHETNRGLSAARNTGTKAAKGEFVFYLDSDDEITPDCIEKLAGAVKEHPEVDMAFGNTKVLLEYTGEKTIYHEDRPSCLLASDIHTSFHLHYSIPVSAWNKLIRRSFIVEHQLYFREGIIFEDTLWSFYLVKYLKSAYYLNQVTHYYHRRKGSITTGFDDYAYGASFCVTYGEILNHLTKGKEAVELKHFARLFNKCYLLNVHTIPEYDVLCCLYLKYTKLYGCWSDYSRLLLVHAIGRIERNLGVITSLNSFRRRIIFYIKIFAHV